MTVWDGVNRLIDRAPSTDALRAHGLHILAAERRRHVGAPVPPELVAAERRAVMVWLAVPALLSRIRAAHDGTIVVLKGPEVALHYRSPVHRSFGDLDLLVEDVGKAERALLAAGCVEAPDPAWAPRHDPDPFSNKHHARPLGWPDLPLKIELHRWPNWPRWLTPPATRELLAAAVPSELDPTVSALPPEHHALVLAAHLWVHEPLGRIRDLLDVMLVARTADPGRVARLAGRWGLARLWRTTVATADALFGVPERHTLAQRTWAANLAGVRERTVLETHLERWTSCFWALPPAIAIKLSASNVAWDLRPAAGESWRAKASRTEAALKAALTPKSAHDRVIGRGARRFSPADRWRQPPGPPE